jgi:hypothetical protein
MYNLKISHGKKILTQFVITHYRDNMYSIKGGTTLTEFRDTVNMQTSIAVEPKSQQLSQISTHLMMAVYDETCSAVTNF